MTNKTSTNSRIFFGASFMVLLIAAIILIVMWSMQNSGSNIIIYRDRIEFIKAVETNLDHGTFSIIEESFDDFDETNDFVFNDGVTQELSPYFTITGFGDATTSDGKTWNRVDVGKPTWLDESRANPNGTPQLALRVCDSRSTCGSGSNCHEFIDLDFAKPMTGWGAWMGRTASSFRISIGGINNNEWVPVGMATDEGFFGFITTQTEFTKLRIDTPDCHGGTGTNLDDMVFLPISGNNGGAARLLRPRS